MQALTLDTELGKSLIIAIILKSGKGTVSKSTLPFVFSLAWKNLECFFGIASWFVTKLEVV